MLFMRYTINKNIKRTLAAVLAVTMLAGCTQKPIGTTAVQVVEFDSVEALAEINRDDLKNSANTLYKVGTSYYAFFPSTGKMELVTQVQEYDKQQITVIDQLYNSTLTADGVTPDATESYVTNVTTIDNLVTTRANYLERELDNCNANMLIDGADTVTLKEYKAQIEEELTQLTQYKQSLVNTTELVVQSLKTQDVQDALMQQVSELLDKQLNSVAEQYKYNQTTGLTTETALKSLEKTVAAQQELISTLQEKYADIDTLLANKRVALTESVNIVDSAEFKSIITQLDTYAASYVAECEQLYNSLSTKADAIENLYKTLQTADSQDYTDILATLQANYADMSATQQNLKKQINTLETALEGASDKQQASNDAGLYDVLQTQLDKHEAELSALEDVLQGSNLATIDSLADVQTALQERIKSIETLQSSLKDTMTQQQIDALKTLKTDIEASIVDGTTATANDLRNYIDTLAGTYDNLDTDTKKSIDALRKLLDDTNAEQSAVNNAVNTLISTLDTDLTAQQAKIEEQKTMLVNLIDTTAGQVQADLMNALETSVTTQEQNLAVQRENLTALINSSDAELADTLKTIFNERIDNTNAELNDAITALENALAEDSNATTSDIATLRTALQDKFTEAVDTSETRLSQEREALETLITTQKDAVVSELTDAIDAVDASRRADVEDILTRLQNSDTTNSETINNAVTELRAVLDADIADQETKLTDAKQVLIALMSEKDADLTTLLTDKVDSLDASVQTDVNNLITALSDETTKRTEAIETAKATVTETLRASITKQENALDDTTNTLNSFITTTNANVNSLNDANTVLAGNVTSISADLTDLTDAYNEYKQINSQTVSGINSSLNDLASNYADYTQANDSAVNKLNTALGNLDADYETYKNTTGETIGNLDALITTVKTATDTNGASVTALQNALDTLSAGAVTDLQTVQAQLSSVLTTLSNTVTDNYNTINAEVLQLTETVTNLTSGTNTLDTKVTDLEANATSTKALIESIQTALTDVQTTLKNKANTSDVLTTLPISTADEPGCVKVDGDTLKVMPDGTIYVNTKVLNQQIPNETIEVGHVWENYEDIPAAYRDYCVQPNFVYMDSPPAEMFYKEVDEVWYMYSYAYTYIEKRKSDDVESTDTSNSHTIKTTQYYTRYTGTAWAIQATRPSSYKTISTVPVTVCYYGYDPSGTGGSDRVWEQYAVKFDTATTTKVETFSTEYFSDWSVTGSVYGSDGNWHSVGSNSGNAGRTEEGKGPSVTKTFLDSWHGNYAAYGPDSSWKPSSFKGAYMAGCTLNKAQRQKMWDAGVLTDFAPIYYDKTLASTVTGSRNYMADYVECKRCFINGIARKGKQGLTWTNEETIKAMPQTLTEGNNDSEAYGYPYGIYNFTDAGLAYKLAYIYGNHVWIYAGTPT